MHSLRIITCEQHCEPAEEDHKPRADREEHETDGMRDQDDAAQKENEQWFCPGNMFRIRDLECSFIVRSVEAESRIAVRKIEHPRIQPKLPAEQF